jgi:hypothetical protein
MKPWTTATAFPLSGAVTGADEGFEDCRRGWWT